ncbi:MAG: hypothetical protein WDM96_12450 [Lacunisphaera sp.]
MNAFGFTLDVILVAGAAWLAGRACAHGLRGLEQLLAWGLLGLMLVAGAGVLLGAAGGLGLAGFLRIHAAAALALLAWRRGQWRADWRAWRGLPRELLAGSASSRAEQALLVLLAVIAVGFVVLASTAQPVVFDALTYRLSRVGHWLQEGRIAVIATDDARLNYMPVVPDLVMAWLLTSATSGFQLAAVAQTLGGLLALGATVGLARLTGLSRLASLGAACLLLGLPNVAPQFTSAYTDLFTTGALAAGYFLWLAALRRGRGSWLGGAAAGLALGAKGTVVYFAPGLLIATAWLAWRHRAGPAAWVRTFAGGLGAVAIFVLPLLARNQHAYGDIFGPRDFVVWHQGVTPGPRESVEKLRLNLASAFAQLCEPNSQPPWWRTAIRAAGESVIRGLPEKDPYAFDGIDRRANLEKIYAVAAPDADVASTGGLLPALGLAACVAAILRRRQPDAALALAWAAMLAVFVVFLHWRLQWQPYLFRFLVLGAPWLAVLVAWGLQTLPSPVRLVAWVVVGATTLQGFVAATFNTYQAGWPATMQPAQSTGYYVFAQWHAWSAALDRPGEPVRPALEVNAPLAAFYRQEPARRVLPEKLSALKGRTAEAVVRSADGWLVAPVAEFFGREGRVMGRTWLFEGDEHHPYSVAAFRALQPGELPVPLLYRNRIVPRGGGVRRELLVRGWDAAPVYLELHNAGAGAVHFTAFAPAGRIENDLPAGARLVLEVSLSPSGFAPVAIDYPGAGQIEARLVR